MTQPRARFTYANVASTIALICVVAGGGGAAYAHGKIGSNDLKKNAVKSKHIKSNQVKSKDIKDGTVTGADVRDGTLADADLGQPTRSGLTEAGVHVSGTGTVRSWFNRLGAKPVVTHFNTGGYDVKIPGATPTDLTYIATVNSGYSLGHCEVDDVTGAGALRVLCRVVADDTPVDTDFQLVLHKS